MKATKPGYILQTTFMCEYFFESQHEMNGWIDAHKLVPRDYNVFKVLPMAPEEYGRRSPRLADTVPPA